MRQKFIRILAFLHGVLLLSGIITGIGAFPVLIAHEYRIESQLPRGFVLMIPLVVTYFASRKLKSIATFIPVSLLSFAVTFLMPMATELRVLTAAVFVWMLIVRILYRTRESAKKDFLTSPSFLTLILFAGLYIIGTYTENEILKTSNYFLAFLYVMLMILYQNCVNLQNYLTINSNIENIPKKQIARTNAGAVAGYMVLTAIVMLVLPMLGIDQVLRNIVKVLLQLIGRLFKGVDLSADDVPETTAPQDVNPLAGLPDSYSSAPLWAQAILQVIKVLFIVLAAGILIGVLVLAVYSVIKRFYRPYSDNADVQEFIQEDEDEKSSLLKEIFKKRLPVLDFSLTGNIRRLYRHTIEKGLKAKKNEKTPLSALSPRELESLAGLEENEHRTLLHETYEKVRYSELPVTQTDLKKLK